MRRSNPLRAHKLRILCRTRLPLGCGQANTSSAWTQAQAFRQEERDVRACPKAAATHRIERAGWQNLPLERKQNEQHDCKKKVGDCVHKHHSGCERHVLKTRFLVACGKPQPICKERGQNPRGDCDLKCAWDLLCKHLSHVFALMV